VCTELLLDVDDVDDVCGTESCINRQLGSTVASIALSGRSLSELYLW